MKTDLDALMSQNNIDILLATGAGQHNPAMVYLTGGGHLTSADLIKVRGQDAVLYHGSMERDEAARTGLKTVGYNSFPLKELMAEAKGDSIRARALRYRRMLADLGIEGGRMVLYGQGEIGSAVATFSTLKELLPDLELVPEAENSLLMTAMATKDAHEIERIRQMGRVTTTVVGKTQDYLSSQRARDGVLVDREGNPVTIGQVKSQINLWLSELGADNPEGTIFAMGRDAGIPHSSGTASDALRLGQTIVYDIFPCEAGGGYYYDFTRTWCLGYATDESQALYDNVRSVFEQLKEELKNGSSCPGYQARTCELFEAQGHPTIGSNPAVENGYVHSLGHGVGLRVHERPWFGSTATSGEVLQPGMVFTIEPGLYYPERGMGVRLEDTLWVRPDGEVEVFAPYPLDLVVPVKG